jgi:hypothetical protein
MRTRVTSGQTAILPPALIFIDDSGKAESTKISYDRLIPDLGFWATYDDL